MRRSTSGPWGCVFVLPLGVALAGCPGASGADTGPDAARADASPREDAAASDAGIDAASDAASTDDDAATLDAFSPDDAGHDAATLASDAALSSDAGGACVMPGTRDPALWPFARTSPWNTSIGSLASYAVETSPGLTLTHGWINCTSWSHPVWIASATDPVRTVRRADGSTCATLRVPDAARPDPEADGHMHLVDETHRIVVETYQASRPALDTIVATDCLTNDLEDAGVYDTWHGTRAYGGSAIGGLIRAGELTSGIHHVIAACTMRAAMNGHPPGGRPYVWPASSADSGWETTYATSGNVAMGSLLAIPPDVDVASLPVAPGMRVLAQALQDYGAYVVDACGDDLGFSAEPGAAAEIPGTMWEDLQVVLPLLRVVTNNGPASVGGGGTPRACLAPPFAS